MSFILVNNFNTTLSAASSSTATTFTVSSSANLPTLAAGEVLPITLNDAATRQVFEICYVTSISSNVLTVERAQEGTSAQNWNVGDFIWNGPTAGTALLQNTVDDFTTSGLITAGGGIAVPSGQTITIPNATSNNQPVALGQFPFSVGAGANQSTGYIKFPNGIILQWGFLDTNGSSSGQTITYPITFPNAMIISSASDQGPGMNTGALVNLSTSQGTLYGGSSAGTYTSTTLGWIAIGY